MHRVIGGLLLAGAVIGSSTAATAAVTRIDVADGVASFVTEDLGASVTALGTATFDAATGTATFPVTSAVPAGDDPSVGRFEHVGSGIEIGAGDTSVAISDLVIDTGADTLGGTVSATASILTAPIDFSFEIITSSAFALTEATGGDLPLEVRFTPGAATLLNELFGTDVLTPDLLLATAGANLDVVETPLPAALPLLAVGVGGLAWTARRRRTAA
jgi:hypothetical protein